MREKTTEMSPWTPEPIATEAAVDHPATNSLSEEQSHREHRAALEATVFGRRLRDDELVFELEAGRLRLCTSPR